MNLTMRMIGEIARRSGRTSLLRLHRKYSVKRYTSFSTNPAVFVQSREQSNVPDTRLQQDNGYNMPTSENKNVDDIMAEAPHAQRFFESSLHYTNTIISRKPAAMFISDEQQKQFNDINWDTATPEQIAHGLNILSHIEKTEEYEEAFAKILINIENNCWNYPDGVIMEMLKGLVYVQSNGFNLPHSGAFYRCLDKECLKRFIKSSISDKLLICYILQFLHIPKFFSFTHVALLKIGCKPQKLTSKNLIQLLYIISVSRKAPINMYELEYRLEQCKEELCITELGIAVLGFFKSRTTIKSLNLFNHIVQEAVNFSSSMDSVTLSAIVKMIRYNMQLQSLLKVSNLMLVVKPRIADVHLMTVTHIAETYVTLNFHRIDVLRLIAQRLKDDIEVARIKDIERICMYLCHFNYTEDRSIYDAIIDEVTKRIHAPHITDAIAYPMSLPRILSSMAQLEIYPHTLIRYVMDDKYIQQLCNGNYNKLDYCYGYLHYSVQIDDPSYDGPLLNRLASNLQTKSLEYLNSTMMMHKPAKQLSEVVYYCKEVIDLPEAIYVDQFLPHYPIRDILIGLDRNKNPIPIVSSLSCKPVWTLKRVHEFLPEGTNLIVLVMGSSQLRMRGTAPIGSLLLTKIRHLKLVGCTPHIIWYEDWGKQENEANRRDFLREILFSHNVPRQC